MTKWIKILSTQSFLDSHLQMMAVWFPLLVWGLIFSTSRFTTLCPVVGYLYVPPPTVLLTSSASACITVASCMLRVWPVSMRPVGRMRYLILFNIVFRLMCLTISDLDFYFFIFFLSTPPRSLSQKCWECTPGQERTFVKLLSTGLWSAPAPVLACSII